MFPSLSFNRSSSTSTSSSSSTSTSKTMFSTTTQTLTSLESTKPTRGEVSQLSRNLAALGPMTSVSRWLPMLSGNQEWIHSEDQPRFFSPSTPSSPITSTASSSTTSFVKALKNKKGKSKAYGESDSSNSSAANSRSSSLSRVHSSGSDSSARRASSSASSSRGWSSSSSSARGSSGDSWVNERGSRFADRGHISISSNSSSTSLEEYALSTSPETFLSPLPSSSSTFKSAPLYEPSSSYDYTTSINSPPSPTFPTIDPTESCPPLFSSPSSQPQVEPREEEGTEGLPSYTCSIHLEGWVSRKQEQSEPGVQAKDRAWKSEYVLIRGTEMKFYKYDLKTRGGSEEESDEEEDVLEGGGSRLQFLHHSDSTADNPLLRTYSLQFADCGLAADYLNRSNVIRVRAEGEQFLLQVKSGKSEEVIRLYETLQKAIGVAVDLDERAMPKFMTMPISRRRARLALVAAREGNVSGEVIPASASEDHWDPSEGLL